MGAEESLAPIARRAAIATMPRLMKSPLILALFSTVLATSCTKEAGAAPATPAAPAAAHTPPATPPAAKTPAAPVAAPTAAPAVQPAVTPVAAPAELKVPALADLGAFLGNIKDGASATAAKAPLEALLKQLQTTKDAAAPAAGGAADALGGLTKAAAGIASKLGVSEDVVKQIGALLEKPEVKAAIGTTLEKLQGLLK